MKLRPLPASEFSTFDAIHRDLLIKNRGVPVNDKILPIWNRDYDMSLLYGGRGGGKSEGVADNLIDECMTQDYFNCYYGRKVFDTVRGSQFETLVHNIRKNNLQDHFSFSDAPSSSMVITYKKNGNKFRPFGSDKASKLKSIKDPTHLWCEEFDQFDFTDFKELLPALRTPRGANRFIGSFNTHEVYPDHWILQLFFPDIFDGDKKLDDEAKRLIAKMKVQKIFINYDDNFFIDKEKYRERLWLSAMGQQDIFDGIAAGAWGMYVNDSPWAFSYRKSKHVSNGTSIPHPVLNRAHPVYLSFDFNRNPFCCSVIQLYDNTVYVLETIKLPRSGVDAMCEYIRVNYPGCLYIVTGDYSGTTETSLFQEQVTHYTLIKSYLNLTDGQLKLKTNPRLQKNSTHVNTILAFFKVVIHATKARALVFDMENVKRRADGTIVKDDRDDPKQQSDALDTFRYFCNSFLDWFKAVV